MSKRFRDLGAEIGSRIATDRGAFGESPARDIAGYALLMVDRHERKATE